MNDANIILTTQWHLAVSCIRNDQIRPKEPRFSAIWMISGMRNRSSWPGNTKNVPKGLKWSRNYKIRFSLSHTVTKSNANTRILWTKLNKTGQNSDLTLSFQKITKSNAWQLTVIDDLEDVVKHRSIKDMNKAALALAAAVKVYEQRVNSLLDTIRHMESTKARPSKGSFELWSVLVEIFSKTNSLRFWWLLSVRRGSITFTGLSRNFFCKNLGKSRKHR